MKTQTQSKNTKNKDKQPEKHKIKRSLHASSWVSNATCTLING